VYVFSVNLNQRRKLIELGCGSDVTYKDIDWDESRFSTYFKDHRQALGQRKAHEIDGEDVMLLPSWAYGFVLRSRRWGEHIIVNVPTTYVLTNMSIVTLKISDLSEVKYESTFDDLVL